MRILTDTKWAAPLLALALLGVYWALPIAVNAWVYPSAYFVELAQLTVVSVVALVGGYCLPLLDFRFTGAASRFVINARVFHFTVWAAFVAFLAVTFATADAIPILSALQGAGTAELSEQRGAFLKARTGPEIALLYLSTLFVSALLPYSLVNLFMDKARGRFLLLLLFFGFSISFLQKALFVNVLLPLLYLGARRGGKNFARTMALVAAGGVILYVVSLISFGGEDDFLTAATGPADWRLYFSASYTPSGVLDHLLWRAFSIPMITAADTLLVFHERLGGEYLYGATSSFLAALFSLERVPLERLVFEQQWSWNDTANSNAVFITEAFVNFGLVGVLLFSFFVGQSLRWFRQSRDEAFKSLWMIYCFTIFSSGLIGTLLSLGYSLMFMFCLFFKLSTQPSTLHSPGILVPAWPSGRRHAA